MTDHNHRPRVAIDIQTTLRDKTGFGFYVNNLIDALVRVEPHFDYQLIAPADRTSDLSTPQRFWWDQIEFPRRAEHALADLIHQPAFSAPLITKAKVVVTVHDLIARLFGSDIRSVWSRAYFGRWMPATYRRADHIIVVSEHTKRDLSEQLHIPEEKMTVIYEAADAAYRPIDDQQSLRAVRQRYHLPDRYLIHIGTLNPRKNLLFLIETFAEIARRDQTMSLVIAGKKGWYYDTLADRTRQLGLEKRVIFAGYIPEEDKPLLLAGATVCVFPSLYEGFGLPPLEAMAVGVPVVASNASSIPEVVGPGGILLKPEDKRGWVKTLREVIARPSLRRALIEKGFLQAQQFSWGRAARQTAAIYEQILTGH